MAHQRSDAADSRERGSGKGPYGRFVESVERAVSHVSFFALLLCAIAAWAMSFPFWASPIKWELALHTASAILSLLLLSLLQNAGRRNEEAMQEKLNVIAEGLSSLMQSRAADDPELEKSVRRLRDAVGLEERH